MKEKLTIEERFNRIEVLLMDIDEAQKAGDIAIYEYSLEEAMHYTYSDKPPIHSYRWETEEEANHDQTLVY